MSGIVARSHGMNLRDTFNYLEYMANESWPNPDDVNIVFIMVVLRIADYIQIDSNRVNPFLLKLKTFNSPISLKEHETHLAIESISFQHLDKERFYALCKPENSSMLVKLQNLFADIQKELDISWAVLGEVYGFIPSIPKIKFRRITSNLESNKFLDNLPYVPKKINFQVNNELSKLLVAPLYGNKATFGVRELIQNAVDACRERHHIEKKLGNDLYDPIVTVSINTIDGQNSVFQITDNGKGMDIDEIMHYFLAIGVSFRKSLAWRKEYIDDKGHTLINRNGKFGIGVLAAFLIGEELTVKTRRHNEKYEYSFKATLDSEFIEISRKENSDFEIGTMLSLIISNEKRKELLKGNEGNDYRTINEIKWSEWYIGDFPRVKYFVDEEEYKPKSDITKNPLNIFDTEIFKNINWKYIKTNDKWGSSYGNTIVACNDILITKSLESSKEKFIFSQEKNVEFVISKKPSFLFDDPEGLFPIKLDRNDIDCIELPFENELYLEVAKSFIAKILNLKIDTTKNIKKIALKNVNQYTRLLFGKNGYSLNIDYFCEYFIAQDIKLIRLVVGEQGLNSTILNIDGNFLFNLEHEKLNLSYSEHIVAPTCGGRILMRNENYEKFFNSDIKRITNTAKKNHTIELKDDLFIIYRVYDYTESPLLLTKENISLISKYDDEIYSVQEVPIRYLCTTGRNYYTTDASYLKSGEILKGLLAQYIGDKVIIPYDIEQRKKLYPHAFEELADYIEKLDE